MNLLSADVGGTKTSLALFSVECGLRKPQFEAIFASQKYSNLEILVKEYLNQIGQTIEGASFGVAGPVREGHVQITNLPWVIETQQLKKHLEISNVFLLNDLEAVAYFIPAMEKADYLTLYEGEKDPQGSVAVIAPGTGLGEAYLTWNGKDYQAYASEGGHASFAPRNSLEMELFQTLYDEGHEHVSFERICSGMGIPLIYSFLKEQGYAKEPNWLAEELKRVGDPTPVIIHVALDDKNPCELASLTLNTFISILGSEAGNLALKVLATGGVYLAGGIPPRIVSALKDERFFEAFVDKGRFSDLLGQMPIHVILNSHAGLLGSARFGLNALFPEKNF